MIYHNNRLNNNDKLQILLSSYDQPSAFKHVQYTITNTVLTEFEKRDITQIY